MVKIVAVRRAAEVDAKLIQLRFCFLLANNASILLLRPCEQTFVFWRAEIIRV
ncbi:MAG: hypothetical protein Q7T96_18955 [Methylobacter sp.]|nr:hypothetical protein [Methylobacter sp.]